MKNSGVEWIGEIPDDWEVRKVKHSFIRKNEKAMQENPTVLSLARSGVKERDISNNEGQLAESYYNYNPVDIDDLLINPMDLYSGANCSISKVKGVISPAYINLRGKKNVSPVFYDYYFKVQYWMMAFFAHGNGVSFENRWTLNNETLQNYPIVAPSFETQQRIASYLDKKCSKIEETIQNQQQVIEKLKDYKQSLITEAVTGKIKIENGKVCGEYESYKESGVEWIGKIPNGWNLTKIAYITTKIGSGKTPNGGAAIYIDEGVLFIRSQNVYNEGLLLDEPMFISDEIDDDMKSTRLANNDVLLNITGGSIGRCCIYEKKYGRANVNQHVCIIRVVPTKVIPKFMQLFWISKVGEISIDIYQTGGNREGMSGDAISKTLIPLPSMNEQKEIADYLDKKCTAIDIAIEQKQKLIVKLTEYKKSLIYECVTGKRDIK